MYVFGEMKSLKTTSAAVTLAFYHYMLLNVKIWASNTCVFDI